MIASSELQLDFSQALKGRLAWVTGASRGIGHAIASQLARAGATVVGTSTTEQGAQALTEQFRALHGVGQGMVLNVCDLDQIEACGAQILNDYGRHPDILINNAGITRDNLLLRMKDTDWNQVIETNLNAIFRLSRLCLKSMIKARYGRIISVGSVIGSSGQAGQANYAAAKAGLVGFSKSLAQEVASRGVTVNVVAPGFIQSEMTGKLPDSQKEQILRQIPSGEMGLPQDVAAAVLYLSSDWARYVTGTTLHVNGGLYFS